ncbi:MAG: hypothetical protein IKN27_08845 [Selenomonadaceae bacterium]|nr:hypothetical protein [Selenomonadaceae bacterium]
MLIVGDNPLCGTINLDAVSLFHIEGTTLQFISNGHRLEMNCGDEIAANITYKKIISAYVAGEKIIYLKDLRSDWT